MRRFSVRWKNFHGYADTGWVTFRPVTVVIGANNSGKTSLLNPLLMLKQTLESKSTRPALVARGGIVNAGSYKDLVHQHDVDQKVSFALRWDEDLPSRPDEKPEPIGAYPPGQVECDFMPSKGVHGELIRLYSYALRDLYGRTMLWRKLTARNNYSLGGPLGALQGAGEAAGELDEIVRRKIRRSQPHSFYFHGARNLSDALLQLREPPIHSTEEEQPSHEAIEVDLSAYTSGYLAAMDFAESHLHSLLGRIDFIGPIRQPVDRVVELSDDIPRSVGPKGEKAPELFFRKGSEPVLHELDAWLRRFDLPDGIRSHPFGDAAFSLSVALSGRTNIADLGFGFSQVFPFLVQSVLAQPGDYLLATQPEIHLNPRLQAELSEIISSIYNKGAGIVVETHSEYLLTRLRSVVARGDIDPQDVAIYFIEGGDGTSTVRLIELDAFGDIDQSGLPREFFSDGLREAITLSNAKKSAAERQAANHDD